MSWALLPAPNTLKPFSLELHLPPFSSSSILQPLHVLSLLSGNVPSEVAPLDYPGDLHPNDTFSEAPTRCRQLWLHFSMASTAVFRVLSTDQNFLSIRVVLFDTRYSP